jgi:integrase
MQKKSDEFRTSKQPDRRPGDSLSREQISAIVTVANTYPSTGIVRDVLQLVLHTGLLSSQLFNLRISDVDIENLRLRLDSHLSPLGTALCPAVAHDAVVLLHLHDLNPESEFVIGDNAAVRISFVRRSLRRLGEQIGIRNLGLQSFRLTFVAMMTKAKVDISTRARPTGHSPVEMPMLSVRRLASLYNETAIDRP